MIPSTNNHAPFIIFAHCQHQNNNQIKQDILTGDMKYSEWMSSDALVANLSNARVLANERETN